MNGSEARVITFGELKAELSKLSLAKEKIVPADFVARQIQIISSYLKKEKGIEQPTIEDILSVIADAPNDLQICTIAIPVGRPAYETATIVGAKWLYRYIVTPLKEKGYEVADLYGPDARRSKLFENLVYKTVYVKWLGHGNTNIITGQNGESILWVGDTAGGEKLKSAGVITFSALSCITAAGLGPWLVSQGYVKSYYGYREEFVFLAGADEVERPFFDADTTFDRVLFEQKTTGEAFQKAIERWNYYISNPNTSEWMKPYLTHDRDVARLIGDTNANPFAEMPPSPPTPPPPDQHKLSLAASGSDMYPRYVTIKLDENVLMDRVISTLPFEYVTDVRLAEGEHKLLFDVYNPPQEMKWTVVLAIDDKTVDMKDAWGGNPALFQFRIGEAPPPTPPTPKKWKIELTSAEKGIGKAKGYAYIGRWKIPIELEITLSTEGTEKGTAEAEE
ncbi:MAG: hypothetical protein QW359_07720 [Metallosphaera sp.]